MLFSEHVGFLVCEVVFKQDIKENELIYLPSPLFVCPTRVRILLGNWKEKLQVIFEIATFFANLATFEIDT